jgi:acyl-coenzyme A synthetase/AMP-(fatty) acid ligase
VPAGDRILYALGGLLVYGPLRNSLGMSRVRLAYTAGEAIGPDLFVFYRSLGINLKQLYGSTETSVMVCVQPDGGVKPDTVGPADEGGGDPHPRKRRDRAALPGTLPRVLPQSGGDGGSQGRRGLVPHGRRRILRCRRAT